jgi:hypothetical protein
MHCVSVWNAMYVPSESTVIVFFPLSALPIGGGGEGVQCVALPGFQYQLKKRVVSHFPLSKGNRRKLPLLAGRKSCAFRLPTTEHLCTVELLPMLFGEQPMEIRIWLVCINTSRLPKKKLIFIHSDWVARSCKGPHYKKKTVVAYPQ